MGSSLLPESQHAELLCSARDISSQGGGLVKELLKDLYAGGVSPLALGSVDESAASVLPLAVVALRGAAAFVGVISTMCFATEVIEALEEVLVVVVVVVVAVAVVVVAEVGVGVVVLVLVVEEKLPRGVVEMLAGASEAL